MLLFVISIFPKVSIQKCIFLIIAVILPFNNDFAFETPKFVSDTDLLTHPENMKIGCLHKNSIIASPANHKMQEFLPTVKNIITCQRVYIRQDDSSPMSEEDYEDHDININRMIIEWLARNMENGPDYNIENFGKYQLSKRCANFN